MNILRRLPTRQLLAVIFGVVASAALVTAVAMAAIGGGPVPAPKPLDRAIQAALKAPAVSGISARITFTNSLIDTSSLGEGRGGNPLLKGADGRLWLTKDGRLRLELFSTRGDTQLSINGPAHTFAFYDGASNTAYEGSLPARSSKDTGTRRAADSHAGPTLKGIDDALSKLAQHADIGPATPTDIAGQPAYSVRVTPKASEGGMIGAFGVAWDAVHGIPLDVAIYAKGSSSPVLELRATNISFGSIPASDLNVAIPPGAKVDRIDTTGTGHGGAASAKRHSLASGEQGISAVKAAVRFALDAPSTLDNLARSSAREVTVNGKPAALLTYGEHLGTVAVLEQAADPSSKHGGALNLGSSGGGGSRGLSLPTTGINGANAAVLPTALGTIVTFERNGIAYTIAGSVPRGVAEAIARGL
jgi:hypothetical protein